MVDLTPATQRLADLVARVSDGQLAGPTPCPAYTVGDLVEHVGGLARAFRAAAEKDITSPYVNGAPAGDAARLEEGWRDRDPGRPGRAGPGVGRPGRVDRDDPDREAWTRPAEAVGVTVADELVVHGWDLARATGQPYETEPADAGRGAGRSWACSPARTRPAGPEVAFGPSREVPEDAPALDRVLALAGRDPAWLAG